MKLNRKKELKEQELIDSNYKQSIKLQRDELINNLQNITEEQKKGARNRSRAKWVEECERCTKYFFGLERKHISNNTIKQLKRENDTLTSSNAEILEEQYNFYKKALYKRWYIWRI